MKVEIVEAILLDMAYQYPAATDGFIQSGYTMSQPVMVDSGALPYTACGGYSPYMPAMPAVSGLDHSQGKWFAPGEALPPGFVVSAHPEGHTAPLEHHAMSDMARDSFVIPASSAAAAVKTGSAALKSKSNKSKKKKSSGCC